MSELPPISSLWLHRESGERRLFLSTDFLHTFVDGFEETVDYKDMASGLVITEPIVDWLSWHANAERIDNHKENDND